MGVSRRCDMNSLRRRRSADASPREHAPVPQPSLKRVRVRSTRMRWLCIAIAITAAAPASADSGFYMEESAGGAPYRGQLSAFDDGAFRVQFGAVLRRGDTMYRVFGAALIPDYAYVDCYGEECAYAARPDAGLAAFGLDTGKRWRLLSLKRLGKPGVYERPGVFVSLHGGLRWLWGNRAIAGYRGPGIGGGAMLEGDLWVFGYFVTAGLDIMRLTGPGEPIRGSTPYVAFGIKLGWL
jgi:hypothetical protein